MVNLPLLITLLLQLLLMLMTVSGQSPCPPTFTYFRDSVTNKVMGKVWLPYRLYQVKYHLVVEISIRDGLPNRHYAGEVKLEKTIENTIWEIENGKPLVYLIHFPVEQPLPRITKITLNGKQECFGFDNFPNTTYVEYIVLEHILLFDSSTQKWFETSFGNATGASGLIYSYEGGLDAPTDAPILEIIPTISPLTQAPTPKLGKRGPTTLDTSGCGRNANFVVPLIANGVAVAQGEWPWVAALFVQVQRLNLQYQCVGSILTNRHIITAAHCLRVKGINANLPASSLYASLGRNKLREWWEEGSVNKQILSYVIHPDYAYNANADSDLAILTLWSSIEFSPTIKPICLWEGPSDLERVVNKTGYVVGWGRDEFGNQSLAELQMVNVPIVSNTECFWSDIRFVSFTSNRTFCAGTQDGSGPCNGDSGSGLMLYDPTEDRYYIRGVASRSIMNRTTLSCDLNKYVVFVDVAKYTDWIREQISTV